MNIERTDRDVNLGDLFGPEKVMILPTDTLYGIGGNAKNQSVTDRIYRVKQRSKEKPLSLHLFSKEKIERYTSELSAKQRELIEELLPGPYTLILPASPEAPRVSVSEKRKVGVRVPANESFRELKTYMDFPLAATSVNKSGEPPLTDFEEIVERYGGLVDLFIEGTDEIEHKPSTVLDITFDPPKVLRGEYPRS